MANKGSYLQSGQYLAVNDTLTSPNGQYSLKLGSDGNLVLGTLWQSHTSSVPGQYFAIMQADGNFVLYHGSDPAHQGAPYWATNTVQGSGQYLALLQDNGNFTIYTQDAGQTNTGNTVWSTDTAAWPRVWGSPSTWMEHLPGSKLLSQLTIPGTHDTGTYKGAGGALAQCQTLSVGDQLSAGIRSLDVRCAHINNAFEIYHTVDQGVSFNDVYTACIQFLQAHPSECIVMLVSSVSPTTNNTRTFEDTFDWYCQGFENYWYLGDSIPTLDAVRGKIVLLRRFAASRVPKGIDVTSWADNATFDILNAAALHVQDEYEVPTIFDIEAKATKVSNFLAKAATGESDEWYINYASGSSGGAYPNAVALGVAGTTAGVNADLSKALANYPVGTRLGTIPMDFPETPAGLLRQLLDLNGYSCLSIGDYDLMNTADRAFAFDYDGSGKLDHLVLYRPGGGAIYILKNSGGQFSPVYAQGDPGSGIGGYDLKSTADRVFAFDYDGTGKPDHLVLYRPGAGIISMVRKEQFS